MAFALAVAPRSPCAPLSRGSISLRLYPQDPPAREIVAEFIAQSRLAEAAGFDGVMTQEHHGGFPNYLPNPLLAATWALEETTTLWAAPCPILLPLRPWTQLVEDLAWSVQRFPGRVGCGVGVGAFSLDFEMAGVPHGEMHARFRAALPDVAAALAGRAQGPIAKDAAVASLATSPIPLVVATQNPKGVERAAKLGLGLVLDSLQSIERIAELSTLHDAAASGPTGPRILIRRVWLGPRESVATDTQMSRYRAVASEATKAQWDPAGGLVTDEDPNRLAEKLADLLRRSGCHGLNLKVFQAGMKPAVVRDQIERLGGEVLPLLRERMPAA